MIKRCLNCFTEYDDSFGLCPNCGVSDVTAREAIDLVPGTILADRYLVGNAIDAGGFGRIYKGWDEKLGTIVAIKEYFPSMIATRARGQKDLTVTAKSKDEYEYRKRRFLAEARTMAHFGSQSNIPNVFEYFEENNTAYIIMEFLEGSSLNKFLKENGRIQDAEFAMTIINEVGHALEALHHEGIIHRDVAPDNIYLCSDKTIHTYLLDFGAARLAEEDEDVVDIVLKPGFSPIEQYIEDDEDRKYLDERSDIYALGATLYMMLTGVKPEESTNRRTKDTVPSPRELCPEIPDNLSNAIMKAMALDKHLRFKNVSEFLRAVNGERKVNSLKKEKLIRKSKQIGSVALAFVVLLFAANYIYARYNRKRLHYELDSCTITIWYEADEGSLKQDAMEAIKTDFTDKYKGVDIKLVRYSHEEYQKELKIAEKEGNLPNVFESSDAPDSILSKCVVMDEVLLSDQVKECTLLKNYENCYPDHKQMPIGFEIPVACLITSGSAGMNYPNMYFTSVADLSLNSPVSCDSRAIDLVSLNFDMDDLVSDRGFFDPEEKWNSALVTSSLYIDDLASLSQSEYLIQHKFVFCDSERPVGRFVYEWSLGGGSKNEIAASERFVSWLLGKPYQTDLMSPEIYAAEGELPLCDDVLNEMIEKGLRSEIEPALPLLKDMTFVQYEPREKVEVVADDEITTVTYYLYETILRRDPTEQELQEWRTISQTDKDVLSQIVRTLILGNEYLTPDVSDKQFLELLGCVVLHRDYAEGEKEQWYREIRMGKQKAEIVEAFLDTTEWRSYCETRGFVIDSDPEAQQEEDTV